MAVAAFLAGCLGADEVETCSGPEAGDALSFAAFGDNGTREFFTHVRYHKHDDDSTSRWTVIVESSSCLW